ncbi:blastula protease 10-like, partial [Saccostrea cucullata]|uniref:blastula protease 10-like n=1 Tax=Saccostrea cuccullata TaxID=36930 RepID=UPI002ED350D9
CYSYVGVVGGAQNLSIEAPGCMTVHTVLHEFLHAMGGSHEQSRSDRASMTSMIWNKIDSKNMYNFVMENTKNALPYDYKSLMQYELDSFGKNRENSMSIPDMSFEYLITNKKDHLSLYDIGEINSAYRCTADCFNQCENGGVLTKENGQCRCKCPSGLKGEDCSELDTSDGCGGFIQLGLGEAYTINMDSYNSGVICTWVVKGTMGSRITAMVDFMDLPFNEFNDCYHWLEFRDYLIGDNGKERCGNESGATFKKMMIGEASRMMIRFNSQKHNNQPPGQGFVVTVEATQSDCSFSPCKNGANCTDIFGGFKCECFNGFSGSLCDNIKASARTICDFQDDFRGCVFQPDPFYSQFEFSFKTSVDYPGNALGFQYIYVPTYGTDYERKKAYLITSAKFEEFERCLSFKYLFSRQYLGTGYDSQVRISYWSVNDQDKTLYTLGKPDIVYQAWQNFSISLPAVQDLK